MVLVLFPVAGYLPVAFRAIGFAVWLLTRPGIQFRKWMWLQSLVLMMYNLRERRTVCELCRCVTFSLGLLRSLSHYMF